MATKRRATKKASKGYASSKQALAGAMGAGKCVGPSPWDSEVDPTTYVILNKIATMVVDQLQPEDQYNIIRHYSLTIEVNEIRSVLTIDDNIIGMLVEFSHNTDMPKPRRMFSNSDDPPPLRYELPLSKPTALEEIAAIILRAKDLREHHLIASALNIKLGQHSG